MRYPLLYVLYQKMFKHLIRERLLGGVGRDVPKLSDECKRYPDDTWLKRQTYRDLAHYRQSCWSRHPNLFNVMHFDGRLVTEEHFEQDDRGRHVASPLRSV